MFITYLVYTLVKDKRNKAPPQMKASLKRQIKSEVLDNDQFLIMGLISSKDHFKMSSRNNKNLKRSRTGEIKNLA